MSRKVFASVEICPKDQKRLAKNRSSVNDNDLYEFLPCESASCYYEYPLKIMLPSSANYGCCLWLYPFTFGGGLVEGDNVNISVKIGEKCCVLWTSLAFPKIYVCENGLDCQLHWNYRVGSQSLLCILPDPVVCYKQASYIQTQNIHMTSDGNLVLLDSFTSGRYARGERWVFSKLKSISSVFFDEKLVFNEALNLQNTPFVTMKETMKSFNIVGTCMIIGPYLMPLYLKILSQLGKCSNYGEKPRGDLLFAVSPLHAGYNAELCGCIIRFASDSVSEAYTKIEELLSPLFHVLGGNPFKNK